MATKFEIKKIGLAKTCFPQKFGTPRQPGLVTGCLAKIIFEEQNDLRSMLDGIHDYSHIWLLWWFDQNTNKSLKAKIAPPKLEGEKRGVLATRSPHRPNPIGLSLVKLLEVKEQYLLVDGIDLTDGTPIIDIKPYLPHIEAVSNAKITWPLEKTKNLLQVELQKTAMEKIPFWERKIETSFNYKISLEKTLVELISQDPRPTLYKEKPYKDDFRLAFYDFDIQFIVEDQTAIIKDLVSRNID